MVQEGEFELRIIIQSLEGEIFENLVIECNAISLKHASMRVSAHLTDRFPEKEINESA